MTCSRRISEALRFSWSFVRLDGYSLKSVYQMPSQLRLRTVVLLKMVLSIACAIDLCCWTWVVFSWFGICLHGSKSHIQEQVKRCLLCIFYASYLWMWVYCVIVESDLKFWTFRNITIKISIITDCFKSPNVEFCLWLLAKVYGSAYFWGCKQFLPKFDCFSQIICKQHVFNVTIANKSRCLHA